MSGRVVLCHVAGVLLVLGACSSGDGSAGDDGISSSTTTAAAGSDESIGSTTAPTTAPTTASTTVGSEGEPDEGDALVDAPTTTVATTVPPVAIDVGRTVVQTTPSSGNPATPTLAWEAVDGAASYTVIVADGAGSVWWSWEGTDEAVVLGGVSSGAAALQIETGVTWTVFAHGGDGALLASSPIRPLER